MTTNKSALDTSDRDIKANDFVQDFATESDKIAIVDASILDMIEHPLAKKAIIIPASNDIAYKIKGLFKDSVINRLEITPKTDSRGNVVQASRQSPDTEVVAKEGIAPLSNDSSLERRERKIYSKAARDHMKSKDRHKPDPGRRIVLKRKRGTKQVSESESELHQLYIDTQGRSVMVEDIRKLKHKRAVKDILDRLFVLPMNSWADCGDHLEHTSGIKINKDNFVVTEGLVYTKDGNRPKFDFDWVFSAREAVKEYIIEEARSVSVDKIVESLKNAARTTRN